jgi:hypothetical protein
MTRKQKKDYGGLDPLIIKNMELAAKYEAMGGGLTPRPYEDEYDDIPSGCRACGGDYPICRRGCPLFYDD